MPVYGYSFAKAEKSALGNNSQWNFKSIPGGKTEEFSQIIQPLNPTRFIKVTGRKKVSLEE